MPFQPEWCTWEFKAVNDSEWDTDVEINSFFTLRKINGDILRMELPEGNDAVYFDAFASEKQPEMWCPDLFGRLYDAMSP